MDEPQGHYDKCNKLEKDKYCMISSICLNKQTKKPKLIGIENRLVVARGSGWGR